MSTIEPLTTNLSQLAVNHISPPPTAPAKFSFTPVNYSPPTNRKPMKVSFTTASRNGSPLHPATHLQLSLKLGDNEVFLEDEFRDADLSVDVAGRGVYSISLPRDKLPKMRVWDDGETTAKVAVTAWKNGRPLGQWVVGEAEMVALTG